MNYRPVRSIPRPDPPPGRYRLRAVQLAAVAQVPALAQAHSGAEPEPERWGPARWGPARWEPARSGPERELPGRGPEPAEAAPAGEPTRPEPSPR